MILIYSILKDISTQYVIDWLKYYDKKFLRLNGDEENFYIEVSEKK